MLTIILSRITKLLIVFAVPLFIYLGFYVIAENNHHERFMSLLKVTNKYMHMLNKADKDKWRDYASLVLDLQHSKIPPEPDIGSITSVYRTFNTKETVPVVIELVKDSIHTNRKHSNNMSFTGIDISSTERIRDFSDSVFSHSDLSNSNLSKTSFRNSNFIYANLQHADLRYTDLKNANLTDTNLRDADLTGANLTGVKLIGADLRGTKLDRAFLSALI